LLVSFRPRHVLVGAATTFALVAATAGVASAHVTVTPGEASAGSYAYLSFSVPHGCEGSPTVELRMEIPEGVISVKPEVVPGWDITTTVGAITPYESEGETISEGVTEVTWKGGPLPDDRLQRFGMSVRLPDTPDEAVPFPVVQVCEEGETAWIEPTPASGEEPEHPAPAVLLTAASEDGHGGGGGDDAAAAEGESETGAEASSTSSDDSDSNGLAIVALVVGALGLVAGAAALVMVRRRPA
jgi:uncharacterized protein YcnI